MEFIWAFLILVGFWSLTALLSSILGLFVPIAFMVLGFFLGIESIIIGFGGLLGNIINVIFVNNYINTQGAMSNIPRLSKFASFGFIIAFVVAIVIRYIFKIDENSINYWYLILIAIILWLFLVLAHRNAAKNGYQTLDNFYESVLKYKIVEKYDDNPKWAIYLYFKNGKEHWSYAKPGSFTAKDPQRDLTYVFMSEQEAFNYANYEFVNAKRTYE